MMVWGVSDQDVIWVEDGFFRLCGFGVELVLLFLLILDYSGIYFDFFCFLDLEILIIKCVCFLLVQIEWVECLVGIIILVQFSKYNLGGGFFVLFEGYCIFVSGQVEDDVLIQLGMCDICINRDFFVVVCVVNFDVVIIYKEYFDVVVGLW